MNKITKFSGRLLFLALAFTEFADAETPRDDRPNFLFILTDDQRFDAMGFMNPVLETPNIDRIRNEGAWMKNAFCTTALCSPSRASFLTGCAASRHGVMANETWDFDNDKTPSYHYLLQQAGYQSAFIGKWHMGHSDMPRPGFDYWLSFKGQGRYIDPDFNENGRRFKAKGYMTDLLTNYALKWLDKNGEKPFALYLSHKAVHQRCIPPGRYKGQYKGKMPDMPINYNDPLSGKPYWQKCLVKQWVKDGYRSSDYRSEGNARHIPKAYPKRKYNNHNLEPYYETLMAVDEGVGRVMDKLAAMGQLDNTVIVFAGDNGFLFGEHRMGDKRVAYEESMRIPMLMRYPKLIKPGTTIDDIVLNMDLCPTFLDLAQVEIPSHVQGKSMVPLFGDAPVQWREQFIYANWVDVQFPQYPRLVSLRTKDWKLVTYPDIDDWDELYHLGKDPGELKNLISNPEYAEKARQLKTQLQKQMKKEAYSASYARLDKTKKQGLVAHYAAGPFDAGNLRDLSPCKNSLQSRGALLQASGDAVAFSPQTSWAVAGNESLDISHCPMTLSVWFKADKDGNIASQGEKGMGAWSLFIDKGIPTFATCDITRFAAAEGLESCLGRWTHLVAVISGSNLDLYIDSKKVASVPRGCYLNLRGRKDLVLGRENNRSIPITPRESFTGELAEFKIYRQYLDPTRAGFPRPDACPGLPKGVK